MWMPSYLLLLTLLPVMVLLLEESNSMPTQLLLLTVLPVMVLLLEESSSMPSSLLLQTLFPIRLLQEDWRKMPSSLSLTVLPLMVLLLETALIPAHSLQLPAFVAVNPTSVVPSAVNIIASPSPHASTTGWPIPFSVTDLSTTTFS